MEKKRDFLSKAWLEGNELIPDIPPLPKAWDRIPERVLQFGTGVLLRGLPDYFIDKANKQGKRQGRIVVVKSTDGGVDGFHRQDNLYTVCVRGIENGETVDRLMINSSISRVLSAKEEWREILDLASSPSMEIVISNTTEVGIVLDHRDMVQHELPFSYPGRLLALLYRRFQHFGNAEDKGLVILPTELIGNNGDELRKIVLQLAKHQTLGEEFLEWLLGANDFCNTLVDRIVPGSLSTESYRLVADKLGYEDRLMIMAEPFRLWAIETSEKRVSDKLFFATVDEGIVVVSDITKFKELKLRLLNATHSLCCGLSSLLGFYTVKAAMEDGPMKHFARTLMMEEIVPSVCSGDISREEAERFAQQVLDRFSNPFLQHKWHQIALNYTSKMNARVFPLVTSYMGKLGKVPDLMAIGVAAFIYYMKCHQESDGKFVGFDSQDTYFIQDEYAHLWCTYWNGAKDETELIAHVFADTKLFHTKVPTAFIDKVAEYLAAMTQGKASFLIESTYNLNRTC
ncbi:tagaturonate reductase [Olivibacter sitiensis]|uniref:tagaturonate reductase n=1 Tax=Olivibacter sitiensis TaxID=376470 RepID=UPI00146FAC7A|nr:tagaturonate reductase [Olivibacter sitiensis]